MKGISAIVVMILILLIGISLTGLGYVTLTSIFSKLTTSSEEAISTTVTTMLAQLKIEAINTAGDEIYIRNIGKVNLTNFVVYKNEVQQSGTTANPTKLPPGDSGKITGVIIITNDVIKVTTAQGATAIQTAP